MAVLLFSICLILGVAPALFFLDRLFDINFERGVLKRPGSKGVFWEPRGFAKTGESKPPRQRSISSAVKWIYKNPSITEDDLEAYRYLIFYRMSLAVGAVVIASGLTYFLFLS